MKKQKEQKEGRKKGKSLTEILLLELASDVTLDEGGLADTTVAHKHALEGVNLVCHFPTQKDQKREKESNKTKTLEKKKTRATPHKEAPQKTRCFFATRNNRYCCSYNFLNPDDVNCDVIVF
mgnify:CR=1 FL=1